MGVGPNFRIRCAICDRPVQNWIAQERADRRNAVEIRAYCHGGAVDVMVFDARVMPSDAIDAIFRGDVEGVAFATPALASQASRSVCEK